MKTDRLWLLAVTLTLSVGCGTKAPPNEPGGSHKSLVARVKAEKTVTTTMTETEIVTRTQTGTATATSVGTGTASAVVTVTRTITGTQTSTTTQSTTSTQTRSAPGNTSTRTATAMNLPVSATSVGTVTAINDWVGAKTYVWTATLTRANTVPTTFTGSGTATGTYADNGVTYSKSGTTTSTMQFTGFVTSTKTQTVAARYSGVVSKTMTATGTGTGWNGRLTWTYTKTSTGSHPETFTQTQTQTLTQTTYPTTTTTATVTGTRTVTQPGTVTNTFTTTISETVTHTITGTATATETSVDGGTGDAGTGTCLANWRDHECSVLCTRETQWDRSHCTTFLDCYLENGTGPTDDPDGTCGVNQFQYGMAPKTIADEVYECLGCSQVPAPCAPIDMSASMTYDPPAVADAEQSFPSPVALRIPSVLAVTQGSAGNGAATLSFQAPGACPTCWRTCTYRGLADSPHPTTPEQQALGRMFGFESCDSSLQPNNSLLVSSLRLHVEQGDALAGPTSVQLITPCATSNPVVIAPIQPGSIPETGSVGESETPETNHPTPPGQPIIPLPYVPPTSCRDIDGCVPMDPNLPVFEIPLSL